MLFEKGPCTRTSCENWHPPECQFYKNETGCKAGGQCLFPHHRVDEQPKKSRKGDPKKKRKRRQECCGFCESVSQLGGVSQDSDALVSPGGKSRGNPMQKVLGPIRKVRFIQSTPRHASIRKKKGPSSGKINVKVFHQRSPYAMKLEDRFHEETERQQRCARSKAWNLVENIFKLKEKDKAAFYFPAEEWVLPAASTKEPEEREFVVDSGASMHRPIRTGDCHHSGMVGQLRSFDTLDSRRKQDHERSDEGSQRVETTLGSGTIERRCVGSHEIDDSIQTYKQDET